MSRAAAAAVGLEYPMCRPVFSRNVSRKTKVSRGPEHGHPKVEVWLFTDIRLTMAPVFTEPDFTKNPGLPDPGKSKGSAPRRFLRLTKAE